MARPNYQLKACVLKTDYVVNQRKFSKLKYQIETLWYRGVMPYDSFNDLVALDKLELLADKLSQNEEYYLEAKKINESFYKRSVRLKERIEHIVCTYPKSLFLTLTFNDLTLNSTTALQRRRIVVKWLKKHVSCYVANIDFGKTNGREHYHAVVGVFDNINLKSWFDSGLGTCVSKTIVKTSSEDALAKYMTKLTNHAIKETNQRSVIIYSRNA